MAFDVTCGECGEKYRSWQRHFCPDVRAAKEAEAALAQRIQQRKEAIIAEAVRSYRTGLLMGGGPLAKSVEAYLGEAQPESVFADGNREEAEGDG